jgi:hypothetical protein
MREDPAVQPYADIADPQDAEPTTDAEVPA